MMDDETKNLFLILPDLIDDVLIGFINSEKELNIDYKTVCGPKDFFSKKKKAGTGPAFY